MSRPHTITTTAQPATSADDPTTAIALDVPPRRRRTIRAVAAGALALMAAVSIWLSLARGHSDPVVLSNADETAVLQAEKVAATTAQSSDVPTNWQEAEILVDEKRQLYDHHHVSGTSATARDEQARLRAEKQQLLSR